MLRLSTLVILATASRCADSECEANSLLQHGASHRRKQAEDDLSICRNPRQMECDIFWNPFSKNAAQTSCGFGAVCMTAGSSLPNVCKCQMGSICGPDGACRARSTEGKSPAAAPAAAPATGGAQVHESYCTNERAQPCKIGFTPFDSAAMACGFGQTCQQVADGRALCQCAMGACGSDGNCAFFNPFDPFASQSPKEAQPAAPAAAVPVEDGVPEDAAPQIEGAGKLDASFCTNTRARVCKIGFTPFFDSHDLACGFGQTCQKVPDGRALCQCAMGMGSCDADGKCGINPLDPFGQQTQEGATTAAPEAPSAVPEAAAAGAAGAAGAATEGAPLDSSFCTNQRAQQCKIGFIPFSDSADLACGFGQTCQQAADGRALCKCAVGSCTSDGSCGGFEDTSAQKTNATAATPDATAGATTDATADATTDATADATTDATADATANATAGTASTSLDESFCTNQRVQACKISFNPFSDSADAACGLGQTCQQIADGQALCKCAMGICQSDGSCALKKTDSTVSQGTNQTGAASGSLDASFCTNQRAQACKIGFIPFMDSSDLACGLGQTCETAADGRALCKCAAGTCGESGDCGGFQNPFAQASQANSSANSTKSAGAASGSLDAAFCTNQRAQACKIGFIPFMDSSDLACGLGQTCETAADGRALCKCVAGTCGESGDCGGFQNPFAQASQANSSANSTKSAGTASGSLHAAFCTNQRAQACKIGFIPFMDSSDLACGLGQTCETAADGRALCKCAAGTCGESGDCGGFQNPFAHASQANSSANSTKSAGTASGSLDAAFCTNQRAQACKIGFIPFMDSSDLACGLGQTCETATDGRALCKCAAGTCSESGDCGGFQNPFAQTNTLAQTAPETAPESAVQTASQGAGQMSSSTAI